jgi:hypothetical protein
MAQFVFVKDDNAVLDYQFDWSLWLGAGETITASQIFVDSGLTLDSSSNTSSIVTIWLSGGVAGKSYKVKNRVTTSASRTEERTITVRVAER